MNGTLLYRIVFYSQLQIDEAHSGWLNEFKGKLVFHSQMCSVPDFIYQLEVCVCVFFFFQSSSPRVLF